MHSMDLYEQHLTYNTKCMRWNAMGYIVNFNASKSLYVKEEEELCGCNLTMNDWPNTQGAHQNLQRLHFDIIRLQTFMHSKQKVAWWWYVVFFYKHRSFSFALICECSRLSWTYLHESGWLLLNNMYVCHHLHGSSII